MWEAIRLRAVAEARYMLETKCTVRACAAKFGVSKSTVHKDVTERLLGIDPALCRRVGEVLSINLRERHIRGGNATRCKYCQRRLRYKKEGYVP